MWRSLLFVPILSERLVAGAARRGADAIVLDLEAAVPVDRKAEARSRLTAAIGGLRGAGAAIAVRVNELGRGGVEDIVQANAADADAIVLPQANPSSTSAAADCAGATPLIPLVESPRSVINALAIADAAHSVVALGFGVEDYAAAIGAPPTPALLQPAAVQVIQAARAADRHAFVVPDTIADYTDMPRFQAAAHEARALGAAGGFAIHPSQVEQLNHVFSATEEDLRHAQSIVAAAEAAHRQGSAVATYRGQMIDAPVEARARSLLARNSGRGPMG